MIQLLSKLGRVQMLNFSLSGLQSMMDVTSGFKEHYTDSKLCSETWTSHLLVKCGRIKSPEWRLLLNVNSHHFLIFFPNTQTLLYMEIYCSHTHRMPYETQSLMTHLLSLSWNFYCSFTGQGSACPKAKDVFNLWLGSSGHQLFYNYIRGWKKNPIRAEVDHGMQNFADSECRIQSTSRLLRGQRWSPEV